MRSHVGINIMVSWLDNKIMIPFVKLLHSVGRSCCRGQTNRGRLCQRNGDVVLRQIRPRTAEAGTTELRATAPFPIKRLFRESRGVWHQFCAPVFHSKTENEHENRTSDTNATKHIHTLTADEMSTEDRHIHVGICTDTRWYLIIYIVCKMTTE